MSSTTYGRRRTIKENLTPWPPFTDPTPCLREAMADTMTLFATNFEEQTFKDSIARCFERTGCYHDNSEDKVFKELAWGKHKCKNRCKTAMPLEEFELIAAFQEKNNIYMHTLIHIHLLLFCNYAHYSTYLIYINIFVYLSYIYTYTHVIYIQNILYFTIICNSFMFGHDQQCRCT